MFYIKPSNIYCKKLSLQNAQIKYPLKVNICLVDEFTNATTDFEYLKYRIVN